MLFHSKPSKTEGFTIFNGISQDGTLELYNALKGSTSDKAMVQWLYTPNVALNGRTPVKTLAEGDVAALQRLTQMAPTDI